MCQPRPAAGLCVVNESGLASGMQLYGAGGHVMSTLCRRGGGGTIGDTTQPWRRPWRRPCGGTRGTACGFTQPTSVVTLAASPAWQSRLRFCTIGSAHHQHRCKQTRWTAAASQTCWAGAVVGDRLGLGNHTLLGHWGSLWGGCSR